jgi:hypothetical protein
MTEQPERLRAAVERLMEAQREALDATNRALDAEGLDEEERSNRLEGALVDVRDILEGALEDTQDMLEGETERRRGSHAAQGGAGLRPPRRAGVPLRARWKTAAYLQRFLGRQRRPAPRRGLVEPLARS